MALNKNTLIADLKAALKTAAAANEKLDPKAEDVQDVAMQNLANALAGAIDTYVRSAEVNTNVTVSVSDVTVTRNRGGSGDTVGYATGSCDGTGKGSLS